MTYKVNCNRIDTGGSPGYSLSYGRGAGKITATVEQTNAGGWELTQGAGHSIIAVKPTLREMKEAWGKLAERAYASREAALPDVDPATLARIAKKTDRDEPTGNVWDGPEPLDVLAEVLHNRMTSANWTPEMWAMVRGCLDRYGRLNPDGTPDRRERHSLAGPAITTAHPPCQAFAKCASCGTDGPCECV